MKKLLGITAAILLSACGGGGGESYHKQTIAHYGDSVTYGTLGDGRLVPSPIEYLNQNSGKCVHTDYSKPGMTSEYARPLWESWMQSSPEQVVVLRFGGADAILGGNLENNTNYMVDIARKYNKTPVITSIIQGNSPDLNNQIKYFNTVLKGIASNKSVMFISVADAGHPTYSVQDNLHPNNDWSNRISNLLIKSLDCGG